MYSLETFIPVNSCRCCVTVSMRSTLKLRILTPVLSFVEFHDILTASKLGTAVTERTLGGSAKINCWSISSEILTEKQ